MVSVSKCLVTGTFLAIICILTILTTTSQALIPNDDPAGQYIFGADSPVTETIPASQQLPDISGNLAVWADARPGGGPGNPARIFLKDLNQGDSEKPLVAIPGIGQSTDGQTQPAISGNLVAWIQGTPGYSSQLHYMLLSESCPGLDACDQTVDLPSGARPAHPAVSGRRIVWEDLRNGSSNPDIYLYDLDNPSLGAQAALHPAGRPDQTGHRWRLGGLDRQPGRHLR